MTTLLLLSVIVTKATDTLRNAFDPTNRAPKVVWNLVAFGFGIAGALVWDLTIPSLPADTPSQAFAGNLIAGLALGAGAGGWHELLDALSGIAKRGSR